MPGFVWGAQCALFLLLHASAVQRLLWLPRVVLVCAYVGATTTSHGPKPANLPCQLLLYPRYHLDHSSLLARHPLPQVSSLLPHNAFYGIVHGVQHHKRTRKLLCK